MQQPTAKNEILQEHKNFVFTSSVMTFQPVHHPCPTHCRLTCQLSQKSITNLFNKAKANMLAQHRPYNLKINLEGDRIPLLGQIYSMSQAKLKTLQEFLDDHIAAAFIRPSQSPHGAPVLFAKKKDGSLCLCIDFHRLNKITKKDRYPLPLIADLLGTPGKAQIYTKINLQHAYHLVRIAEGNKWKTTFRTRYRSFE